MSESKSEGESVLPNALRPEMVEDGHAADEDAQLALAYIAVRARTGINRVNGAPRMPMIPKMMIPTAKKTSAQLALMLRMVGSKRNGLEAHQLSARLM